MLPFAFDATIVLYFTASFFAVSLLLKGVVISSSEVLIQLMFCHVFVLLINPASYKIAVESILVETTNLFSH